MVLFKSFSLFGKVFLLIVDFVFKFTKLPICISLCLVEFLQNCGLEFSAMKSHVTVFPFVFWRFSIFLLGCLVSVVVPDS